MAGRPITTARKVTDLEEQAAHLFALTFTTAPEALVADFMHKRPLPDTQAAGLWENLFRAVRGTAMLAEMVGRFYRKRANLAEPGPFAELFEDSGQGLQPSGVTPGDAASPSEAADPDKEPG